MNNGREKLIQELRALSAECKALRAELARNETKHSHQFRGVAKQASRLAIGSPPLQRSLETWLQQWEERRPAIPVEETGIVIHAIAGNFVSRKLLMWSLAIVTGLPALITVIFLWQQTGFLKRQNDLLLDAAEERRSVELQRIMREQSNSGANFRFGMRARQVAFIDYLDFLRQRERFGLAANASTLSQSQFPGAFWYSTDFGGYSYTQSDFTNSRFENCHFADARFLMANHSGSNFVDCDFSNSSPGKFEKCQVENGNFSGTTCSFTSLRNSQFTNSNFSGATFNYDPGFQNPDASPPTPPSAFKGLVFEHCDFSGASFDGATPISDAEFINCIFDSKTVFPTEFNPLKNGFSQASAP